MGVNRVEQWVAGLRIGVEYGGVMPVVTGGFFRDRNTARFGSLAEEVDREAGGVEVTIGGGEQFGIARGGVVHEDHEELVSQSDPVGRVGFGEERLDRFVAHVREV